MAHRSRSDFLILPRRRRRILALALAVPLLAPSASWAQPAEGGVDGQGDPAPIEVVDGGASDDPVAALEVAVALFDEGGRAAAAESYLAWLAAHPEARLAAVQFSRALGERSAWEEAITFLEAYLAARGAAGLADPMASLEVGVLQQSLLRYEAAVPHFQAVPEQAGVTYQMAQLNLGKALRALGRFEEARVVYGPLRTGGAAVFVAAAECEIALALEGPDSAVSCLAEARRGLGDHPAFDQAEALAAYLGGDFDRAAVLVDALLALGGNPGPRTTTLRPLVVLARGGPEEALGVVDAIDQVSVLGERDALGAMMLAAGGDQEGAAARYASAVARNPLFADPQEAGRRLYWHPDATAAFERAAGSTEEPALSASQEDAASSPAGGPTEEGSGCCRTVGSGTGGSGADGSASLWLAFGLLLLLRRRSQPVSGRGRGPSN